MPTYDYRCEKCGHELAVFQSISADPIKECPKCGDAALRRLIGAGAGIIFKGSGFYETDYKRQRTKSSDKKTDDSGGSDKKSTTDAAKPAPKSDSSE